MHYEGQLTCFKPRYFRQMNPVTIGLQSDMQVLSVHFRVASLFPPHSSLVTNPHTGSGRRAVDGLTLWGKTSPFNVWEERE